MNYLFKLDGKTITATNIHTGNKIVIATAPYWMKPYSDWYHWINNIWEFKDKSFDFWESKAELREKELKRAYLFRKYDEDKIRTYWWMKLRILQAEKWLSKLKSEGVEYVIFSSVKEIKEFVKERPNYEFEVYELNDLLYSDEPRRSGYFEGHTEKVGYFKYYGKNSVFHPQREIHAIPMFR